MCVGCEGGGVVGVWGMRIRGPSHHVQPALVRGRKDGPDKTQSEVESSHSWLRGLKLITLDPKTYVHIAHALRLARSSAG